MKRNQKVVIYSESGEETIRTIGKVNTIGRDFVMLTKLNERIWFPYYTIKSANILTGTPNFTDSHQYIIYDNDLKRKLLYNFGETVLKREELIRQFYEESLATHLKSWRSMWVKIRTGKETIYGKIQNVDRDQLQISFLNKMVDVKLKHISSVHSIRLVSLLSLFEKKQLR
ncbi:hypothetical protein D8M04_15890 [Oceanobacillus piezotolerans]|uniref:DUF2642 domain-containing protein n=1 Tax=Oceanobacillus piezotolerans TaxID=2448030 RepID=A0A498D309_9BACI|nr:hypothetical protein [Oceanobacillus piezotolerans]RLL42063.1 hypothetical protein D8M04_15890 [Oceanobacillus piezotolerans]